MKTKIILIVTFVVTAGCAVTIKAQTANILEGAKIVAVDGHFLGIITQNQTSQYSLANKISPYGSKISETSIFNHISDYGSRISEMSPFNPIANTPPKLITTDGKWAYLTVNKILQPRINPYTVMGYIDYVE